MKHHLRRILALSAIILFSNLAIAGAPLKGVDVKLGKNPGGTPAARTTTDGKGNFGFGVLPQGSYSVIIKFIVKSSLAKALPTAAVVVVHGAVGGDKKASTSLARKSGSVIAADRVVQNVLTFTADGIHAVTGNITAAD